MIVFVDIKYYLDLVNDNFSWFECDAFRNVWLKDRATRAGLSFAWLRADRIVRACEKRMIDLVPATTFESILEKPVASYQGQLSIF